LSNHNFSKLVDLVARLRGPQGCPWDRAQDYDSVKGLMLEEVYEVVDAVNARDFDGLADELGDLLLQVIFYSRLAEEEHRFTVDDVTERLYEKLVRRHPHVFGETRARTSQEALESWQRVKQSEKQAAVGREPSGRDSARDASRAEPAKPILNGVSRSLPSLLEAHEIGKHAAQCGFDWPDVESLLDKVEEEISELRLELRGAKPANHHRVEEEVGDLLFVAANLARFVRSDAESCLRQANRKFRRRFEAMESRARNQGKTLSELEARELDALWNSVKRAEAGCDT
jgi:ATP diphosphatase